MDIRNCPECGAGTVNAGLALWADAAELTVVYECEECAWAGVESEYWADGSLLRVATAA